MSNVIVLGCGPAGLAAVHAFASVGHQVLCVSRKARSPIAGTQYLSGPIKGVTPEHPAATVEYLTRGTHDQYRRKVYTAIKNDEVLGAVSPAALPQEQQAWDLRAAYDHLWNWYAPEVAHVEELDSNSFRQLQNSPAFLGAHLVVSTIPAPALCVKRGEHRFHSQPVWIAPGEMGALPDNTVICNGEESPAWYRTSRVFGEGYTEWPERRKPPVSNVRKVEKPIATDCDCWQIQDRPVNRLGRLGAWKKGVLIHDAYTEATQMAEAL